MMTWRRLARAVIARKPGQPKMGSRPKLRWRCDRLDGAQTAVAPVIKPCDARRQHAQEEQTC